MHVYTMRGETLRARSLLHTIVNHIFLIVQVVNKYPYAQVDKRHIDKSLLLPDRLGLLLLGEVHAY